MLPKPNSPRVHTILQEAATLSQSDLLHLIAQLAERAQQQTSPEAASTVQWTDIEGILEGSLTGMDAQEWVNQMREQDWERDVN